MKMRRITAVLVATIAVLVVALVVVGATNGLKLSEDLTYGDLLVGLGTLALAIMTAVLAEATFGVDKRAADRERQQNGREARGIARLIDGELEIVQRSWEVAQGSELWAYGLQIPHGAWDNYAAIVLQSITPGDGLELIRFFNQLAAWETEVVVRYTDQIGPIVQVGKDAYWEQQFQGLRQPLSNARRILAPLAY